MQIEHNPDEKRPTSTIWWIAWAIVALLWTAQIYLDGWSSLNWTQISLGGVTVGVLAIWAIEVTGNRVPESWARRNRRIRKH